MAVLSVSRSTLAFPAKYNSLLQASDVTPETLGGMVLLTPTSVDITGGGSETATTLANGSVEFSACQTLSLNGVFSADYDNYMISVRHLGSGQGAVEFRLRSGGTDESSASNYYTWQQLAAVSTTVSGTRTTTSSGRVGQQSTANRSGDNIFIYGPFLAQPTAARNTNVQGRDGAQLVDYAFTHSLSNSYDGCTLIGEGGSNLSGLVSVFGLVGA